MTPKPEICFNKPDIQITVILTQHAFNRDQ